MGPRANFNLVILPPESDSLVTQVDICGAKWPRGHRRALTTMPQDVDLKIALGKIIHLQNKIMGRDPFEKIMNAPNAGWVETLR